MNPIDRSTTSSLSVPVYSGKMRISCDGCRKIHLYCDGIADTKAGAAEEECSNCLRLDIPCMFSRALQPGPKIANKRRKYRNASTWLVKTNLQSSCVHCVKNYIKCNGIAGSKAGKAENPCTECLDSGIECTFRKRPARSIRNTAPLNPTNDEPAVEQAAAPDEIAESPAGKAENPPTECPDSGIECAFREPPARSVQNAPSLNPTNDEPAVEQAAAPAGTQAMQLPTRLSTLHVLRKSAPFIEFSGSNLYLIDLCQFDEVRVHAANPNYPVCLLIGSSHIGKITFTNSSIPFTNCVLRYPTSNAPTIVNGKDVIVWSPNPACLRGPSREIPSYTYELASYSNMYSQHAILQGNIITVSDCNLATCRIIPTTEYMPVIVYVKNTILQTPINFRTSSGYYPNLVIVP